jgi:thiamine biosynthesis lipoprotein
VGASAAFRAIGTVHRILVTERRVVAQATDLAREHLADLDVAVSRFRPDPEVRRLAAAAEQGDAWCIASPVFGAALAAGLRAAALTDGLVDPTVGAAVAHTGYDADLDIVRSREARTAADARPAGDAGRSRVALGRL